MLAGKRGFDIVSNKKHKFININNCLLTTEHFKSLQRLQ